MTWSKNMKITSQMIRAYKQALLLEPREDDVPLDAYFSVDDYESLSNFKVEAILENALQAIPKQILVGMIYETMQDLGLDEGSAISDICWDIAQVMFDRFDDWPVTPFYQEFVRIGKGCIVARYRAVATKHGKVTIRRVFLND
jgi:hypothetical protein